MPKVKGKVKAKKVAVKKAKPIGKITHYFGNISVAVVKLTAPLKVGDTIRVEGGESTDFKQKVASMQVDHESVKTAKKGKSLGLKVKEKVREGYVVYKV